MFKWRKREQGFEWHSYVRTTIKLRREARREKAEQIKDQAVGAVKAAGAAAADGVIAAGSAAADGAKLAGAKAAESAKVAGAKAAEGAKVAGAKAAVGARAAGVVAGAAAREGARGLGAGSRVAAIGLGHAARATAAGTGSFLASTGGFMITLLKPLLDLVARPNVGKPLAIVGALLLAAGVGRASIVRPIDGEAKIALAVGFVALVLAVLPRLLLGKGLVLPGPLSRIKPAGRGAAATLLAVALTGGGAYAWVQGARIGDLSLNGRKFASLPKLPFAAREIIEGRATAIGPDSMRVGAAVVRLADVETPERDQVCTGQKNRRWRCGDTTAAALAKLANNRSLKCEVQSKEASGTVLGRCMDGEQDIAGQLVKGGHAFASSGLMAKYGALETEAKTAKAGIWSGDAVRPTEWRQKVWEEAKKRAPTGCPIKGQVAGGARTYVLPWSAQYERVQVNPRTGGRWFCTEEEAISAGWRVAAQ